MHLYLKKKKEHPKPNKEKTNQQNFSILSKYEIQKTGIRGIF